MTNHGFYVSFKRTDEERRIEDISKENEILKSKIDKSTEQLEKLANKVNESKD